YHSSSFIACRSIHAVHKLNASAVYPLLEKFFKYQKGYYNTPTYTKTRAAVVAKIANNLVAPVIGEANSAAYRAGFNDSRSDQAARISFKVCSTRLTLYVVFYNLYCSRHNIHLMFSLFYSLVVHEVSPGHLTTLLMAYHLGTLIFLWTMTSGYPHLIHWLTRCRELSRCKL
uniref:Uncharacterized protein n=1 Tax=Triticum urartu TaxID=4572 RepID=A0A8R7PA05_TRIUA